MTKKSDSKRSPSQKPAKWTKADMKAAKPMPMPIPRPKKKR